MKLEQAIPWQEIILPAPVPDPWSWLAWAVLCLGSLSLLAALAWGWWHRPSRLARRGLARIRRQLAEGRLEPRAGLHAAAACLRERPLSQADRQRLARRFAASVPSQAELDAWLSGWQAELDS